MKDRIQTSMPDSIYGVLSRGAELFPNAPAILGVEKASLGYGALVRHIESTVQELRNAGIGKTDRVAIVANNGAEAGVCCLAVAAGAIAAPLNPAYAKSEFEFYLCDLSPKALIVDSGPASLAASVAQSLGIPVLQLEAAAEGPAGTFRLKHDTRMRSDEPCILSSAEDVALLLYTTGTTSRPKKVPLTHANLCKSAAANRDCLGLTAEDRCLNVMPLFHIHGLCFALLTSMSAGGSIVCTPGFHALRFFDWLSTFGATWYTSAPTMHQAILGRAEGYRECIEGSRLRFIRSGASALPVTVMNGLEKVFGVPVIEAYAMTETGLIAINRLPPGGRKAGSVGLPIGCDVAIVDENRHDVAVGEVGDVVVRGGSLTCGYEDNPEANRQSFVDGWFYTGDRGKFDSDGYLFLTGRTSDTINRGGEKISPWEIEEVLMQHPAVEQVVVFAVAHEGLGEDIGAGVVLRHGAVREHHELWESELQEFVRQYLADFKVPRSVFLVPEIPRGSTGKPQRKLLAATLVASDPRSLPGISSLCPPLVAETRTQVRLAAIWEAVLEIKDIGINDDFFQLGGDSVFAAQIFARIQREFGIGVTMIQLFRAPTISKLAALLDSTATLGESASLKGIDQRSRDLPLLLAQQRLWFLSQTDSGNGAYHVCWGVHLKGELNRTCLANALDRIAARHEVLRTTFHSIQGEVVQRFASAEGHHFDLVECELRQGEESKSLKEFASQRIRMPFDLQAGPVVRGWLIRHSENEYTLLIVMHHMVSDGWSLTVFINELSAFYTAFIQGESEPLPALDVHYGDYVVWQRKWMTGKILEEQAEYWKKALLGAPALLELSTDRPRPAQQNYAGEYCELALSGDLTTRLKNLSRRCGTTLYMTLLAGWATLLSRLSGQADVVIGTPTANRSRLETETLIGFFVNTLPLRVETGGSPSVRELLERVKIHVLGAQQHQDIPFDQIVEAVRPVRSIGHTPLFQVMFTWQNVPPGRLVLPGLECKPLDLATMCSAAKFDVTLVLREVGGTIQGGVEYAISLFDAATIERYLEFLRRLLEAMVDREAESVDQLPILGERERYQVLYGWNSTAVKTSSDRCVHELFEDQAVRSLEATAVVFEDKSLTYAELNRRANQLAHYLRKMGVRPDARVGICVERGLEMIVGLLAILKAGGAYVPLDPAYPAHRLRYMVQDSAPALLLASRNLEGAFAQIPQLRMLDLTADAAYWENEPATNPDAADVGPGSSKLAYVIYTSGSTGAPKGVMIEHRSLANYLQWSNDTYYQQSGSGSPIVHSIGFDGVITTLFGPLLSGQTLRLFREGSELSSIAQFDGANEVPYTLVKVTPSHLKLWNRMIPEGCSKAPTQILMIGGEALVPSDVLFWQKRYPEVRLVNHFGPTEGTVGCCTYEITTPVSESHSIPIGRPIWNSRIYILDGYRQPVPIGVTGELYIGGAGVARGYLNRDELTAQRFVPDPFAMESDGRMYRTGDLGRWLPNGTIEFLGRNDSQVKIRGYRIELGEIEEILKRHPSVLEAVVVARKSQEGNKQLTAYYTTQSEHFLNGTQEANTLRAHVANALPEYMVPAAYVRLERLPLTPNGKFDAERLPAPGLDAYPVGTYEAPVGPTETTVAETWAEVLGLERVGRHDNFFELGGHSLLAVRVIELLGQRGVYADVRVLFLSPTVAGVAEAVGDVKAIDVPQNRVPDTSKRTNSLQNLEIRL